MHPLARAPFLVASLALAACGSAPQDTTPADTSTTGDTADPAEDDTDTGHADDGTTTAEPEPPPLVPIMASGITVPRVEVNQGVAIPIVDGGEWVDGLGRAAPIAQNRTTLIRADWELAPDWQPREIEARLVLTFADGSEETADKTVMIDGPSHAGDLDRSFWWMLPPELALAGTKFQIELWETELAAEDTPPPDPPPVMPPGDPMLVGFEDSFQALRVTIVPVAHDLGASCIPAPTIDDDVLEVYRKHLFQLYPVELVDLEVREPFTFTGSLTTSFNPLLSELSMLRFDDGADPGRYYYGIVRPCDGGNEAGGQAIDIPDWPTPDNAWTRVAAGLWWGEDGANMIVHELGHTQGRRHVECSGDEALPDPRYPYTGGAIGVWGFGVEDWKMHAPSTATDYMTYCTQDDWSSDWGWNAVFPFIREVSSWELGSAPPPDGDGMLLIGALEPDGSAEWFTVPGRMSDRSPTPGYSLEIADAAGVEAIPVSVRPRPHGDTQNVVAEIRPAQASAPALTLLAGEQRITIDPAAVRGRHATR